MFAFYYSFLSCCEDKKRKRKRECRCLLYRERPMCIATLTQAVTDSFWKSRKSSLGLTGAAAFNHSPSFFLFFFFIIIFNCQKIKIKLKIEIGIKIKIKGAENKFWFLNLREIL